MLLLTKKVRISTARLESLFNTFRPKETSPRPLSLEVVSATLTPEMKLSKTQLPNFTGPYTEWIPFIYLFRSSVVWNTDNTNSEKLNNHQACLRGDIAKLRGSVVIIDTNYDVFLTFLQEKYANKRCVVQAHLKIISSQASMNSESNLRLRKNLEI